MTADHGREGPGLACSAPVGALLLLAAFAAGAGFVIATALRETTLQRHMLDAQLMGGRTSISA